MAEKTKEIPKGYKQTELGIIPEDWEVKRLGEIVDFDKGQGLSKGKVDVNGKYECILYGELFTTYKEYTYEVISKTNYFEGKPSKYGDILLPGSTTTSGIDLARATALLKENVLLGSDINILRAKHNDYNPIFLAFLLTHIYKNKIAQKTKGITVHHLHGRELVDLEIVLPSHPEEQTAIAQTLSDMDALIETLDKLIAKKKKIKQGAMQELLTGKRRLPGFGKGKGYKQTELGIIPEDWEVKKLGEIGEITGAGIDKKIKQNEIRVRLLNYMDVFQKDFLYNNEINFWTTAPKNKIEQCSVKKGDIFFTPSSELQTDIAISAVSMEDMPCVVYSYHIVRFRLKDNWDIKFRTYIFNTTTFLKQAEKLAEGSGKRYVISLKKFKELKIYYPVNIEEQTAIAQTLSDMDAEIEALEAKKQKYEKIKKDAMQLLLTGKIRLKNFGKN